MKSLIETLTEVRDGVSSLDEQYHTQATVSTLRKTIRRLRATANGVSESADNVAAEAAEIKDQRDSLLNLAESLLERTTMMELAERQALEDERQEEILERETVKETALERLEEILQELIEHVEEQIVVQEMVEEDDEDVEDLDEDDESTSDLTLDTFLDGLVYDIQQEGIEDQQDAIGILSGTVNQLVEEGMLPEIPELGADSEESAEWTMRALRLDLPGLVTHLDRSVESE